MTAHLLFLFVLCVLVTNTLSFPHTPSPQLHTASPSTSRSKPNCKCHPGNGQKDPSPMPTPRDNMASMPMSRNDMASMLSSHDSMAPMPTPRDSMASMPASHSNTTASQEDRAMTTGLDMKMSPMAFHSSFESDVYLFDGLKINHPGLYAMLLMVIFILSLLLEFIKANRNKAIRKWGSIRHYGETTGISMTFRKIKANLVKGTLKFVETGLGYLLMLLIMSFNVGVLLTTVTGLTVGYLMFSKEEHAPTEK